MLKINRKINQQPGVNCTRIIINLFHRKTTNYKRQGR